MVETPDRPEDAYEADREVYGEQSVDPEDQLQPEDTLVDRGLDDALDEGYSPPDREPKNLSHGTTLEEERAGDSLEERWAQEEHEVDPYADETDHGTADRRAGRLVAPDEGFGEDSEKDEIARDVGIAGGGASAEEAAMHLMAEEGDEDQEERFLEDDSDPDPESRPHR